MTDEQFRDWLKRQSFVRRTVIAHLTRQHGEELLRPVLAAAVRRDAERTSLHSRMAQEVAARNARLREQEQHADRLSDLEWRRAIRGAAR